MKLGINISCHVGPNAIHARPVSGGAPLPPATLPSALPRVTEPVTAPVSVGKREVRAFGTVRPSRKPAGYAQHVADRHDGDPSDLNARDITKRVTSRLDAGEIIQWPANMAEPTAINSDRPTRKGA